MKKITSVLFITMFTISLVGCSGQKAESPKDAINQAATIEDVNKKADYLVSQANAFYKSKEYKEAIEVANHVLSKVDQESEKAKALIEKAKAELEAQAKAAVADAKDKLGSFGK